MCFNADLDLIHVYCNLSIEVFILYFTVSSSKSNKKVKKNTEYFPSYSYLLALNISCIFSKLFPRLYKTFIHLNY